MATQVGASGGAAVGAGANAQGNILSHEGAALGGGTNVSGAGAGTGHVSAGQSGVIHDSSPAVTAGGHAAAAGGGSSVIQSPSTPAHADPGGTAAGHSAASVGAHSALPGTSAVGDPSGHAAFDASDQSAADAPNHSVFDHNSYDPAASHTPVQSDPMTHHPMDPHTGF
ncbi:hypothetical protein [Mycobacterium sp. 852002-30065_SCH5024008]|uniref:hypothetical protein n=1 Tax=Mycobacterium sp. 852002-30065_SCH5024008 TaxID=1834088 RepID=UPI001E2A266B|nr:hypothetical protein [Mycobacterium sp. 852002-30065_SCH5024008]